MLTIIYICPGTSISSHHTNTVVRTLARVKIEAGTNCVTVHLALHCLADLIPTKPRKDGGIRSGHARLR